MRGGATATKQSIKAIRTNNLSLGTPSKADTIVNREGYALGYSEKHEQPLWVTYELTKAEVKNKKVHRSSAEFQPDPAIRTGSAQLSDYRRSGYDRGHMAPAADMRWSQQAMNECFYLSNICPQENRFNAGNWADLESLMRHWANCYGAIWIVTGPVFGEDKSIGANKVTVPTAFYKVVYVPSKKRGIGFLLPHTGGLLRGDAPRNDGGGVSSLRGTAGDEAIHENKLKRYATTIDAVEQTTGLDFFSALADDEEARTESNCETTHWTW